MITALLCFAAGLVVGWNFLPQPEFVKGLVGKFTGLFKKNQE